MSAQARVDRLHPDRTVQLEILEPPRCPGCERWCLWRLAPTAPLRVESSLVLEPDELVTISIDRRHLLRGALMLHGLPWAGLLVGAVAGVTTIGGDLGALLGAIGGLASGSILARRQQANWKISTVLTRPGGVREDAATL